MNPHRLKAYLMLLTVAAIWGTAGPIIKYTLSGIDPLPFLTYRLSISAVFALCFFIYKYLQGKKFRRLKAHLPLVIIYGLLAAPISLGILFIALDYTTVLDLVLISVISPLIVTAGGSIFFKDHITKREKIGISIVIIGVLLNSLYPVIKSEGLKFSANILLLINLIADSASILVAKKATQFKIQSANLTNAAFVIGALTLIPVTILIYGWGNFTQQIISLPFNYQLGVWYMALFSGSIAYYLFVRAQKTIEVSEAILFNYLQPLFMIPLAIFWLHESLTPSFIYGAVIITFGLIIAESKKHNNNKHI